MSLIEVKDIDDLTMVTALIVHEAKGEPFLGKLAVACVVRTRKADKRWPNTWKGVALQKTQFSCFNEMSRNGLTDAQYAKHFPRNFNDVWWRECKFSAFGIIYNLYGDVVSGANHYYNPKKCSPSWADPKKVIANIGNHRFLKL